jgi:hypothetical protein
MIPQPSLNPVNPVFSGTNRPVNLNFLEVLNKKHLDNG